MILEIRWQKKKSADNYVGRPNYQNSGANGVPAFGTECACILACGLPVGHAGTIVGGGHLSCYWGSGVLFPRKFLNFICC